MTNNIRLKKSLGQNFLLSNAIAKKLVNSANIALNDVVVEVGPGKGIITDILLQKTNRVVAVEKDERMVEYLKEKFSREVLSEKLILVHEDILNFSPQNWKLEIGNWKLIGAIPYYITGAFLRKFLSVHEQPKTIAVIIQKEVAERIIAKKDKPLDSARGKESVLSISVKAYGEPHYIQTVSRKLFSPEPRVDSAIISIKNISKMFFDGVSEEVFFNMIRAGFGSKRKKLINNIKIIPKDKLKNILQDLKISEYIRAEDITLPYWKKIIQKID